MLKQTLESEIMELQHTISHEHDKYVFTSETRQCPPPSLTFDPISGDRWCLSRSVYHTSEATAHHPLPTRPKIVL